MQLAQLSRCVVEMHQRCVQSHDRVRRIRRLALPRSRALVRTARERLHRAALLRRAR
jgi:hypothetical protein